MAATLKVLSLGAGVQSSTLALMAARGELECPDFAVFADTGAEPRSVYVWLDWLCKQLPYEVHRVSKGDLALESCKVRDSKAGTKYQKYAIPAFIDAPKGAPGMQMRHCTLDFKIDPILKFLGKKREGRDVEQWIGISFDEMQRMKEARKPWIKNRWPLIERGMRRGNCIDWMKRNGYPEPPRSSCVFCPYHNDAEWLRLKTEEPIEFAAAVKYEAQYQNAFKETKMRGTPYLHRSRKLLADIDFEPNDAQAAFTFGIDNECEGVCGI